MRCLQRVMSLKGLLDRDLCFVKGRADKGIYPGGCNASMRRVPFGMDSPQLVMNWLGAKRRIATGMNS